MRTSQSLLYLGTLLISAISVAHCSEYFQCPSNYMITLDEISPVHKYFLGHIKQSETSSNFLASRKYNGNLRGTDGHYNLYWSHIKTVPDPYKHGNKYHYYELLTDYGGLVGVFQVADGQNMGVNDKLCPKYERGSPVMPAYGAGATPLVHF